ncbi:MAG: glycoside hydrolase family 31 protein [Clostridia bacterium]|nr:glycoside hydrolase family 31 protein [Clostridia bacterium]
MAFYQQENKLCLRYEQEWVEIEAWGTNAFRVRGTQNSRFTGEGKGLFFHPTQTAQVEITETGASIRNGRIRCEVTPTGVMTFYRDDTVILKEYYRSPRTSTYHGKCLEIIARQYIPLDGNEFSLTALFETDPKEKIYGMGQYQQSELDVKGCVLELAQRNSQISIPFYLSSLGYGFLWNHPGVGKVFFGKNRTEWTAEAADELDYWITVGDTPKEIMESFTQVSGRSPAFPDNALGLWQCKLRYRTQEEVLAVAREYARRKIPLDVIVIDYFHWTEQGEWKFDPKCFPDPKAMMDELRSLGIRCMVSIWPTVPKKSEHYAEMKELDLLVRTERGNGDTFQWNGNASFYDSTNPQACAYIWDKIRQNYGSFGIDMFWLDVAEPEYQPYDFHQYRYHAGRVLKTAGLYPQRHAKAFWDAQTAEGQTDVVNLIRCAWVGSQQYGAVVWSGDVESSFQAFREQFCAGLNMGLSGLAWWTADVGGFYGGNVDDPKFHELLIRWYQYAVFSPILRMHGNRLPKQFLPGEMEGSGAPNELWSYGEEVYEILKAWLDIRLSLKDYIASLYREASENGSPLLRTMFYEFPEDETCWCLTDQYMFGSRYLVAPVTELGMTERQVYLPTGRWKDFHGDAVYEGGQTVTVPTPLSVTPVFERL